MYRVRHVVYQPRGSSWHNPWVSRIRTTSKPTSNPHHDVETHAEPASARRNSRRTRVTTRRHPRRTRVESDTETAPPLTSGASSGAPGARAGRARGRPPGPASSACRSCRTAARARTGPCPAAGSPVPLLLLLRGGLQLGDLDALRRPVRQARRASRVVADRVRPPPGRRAGRRRRVHPAHPSTAAPGATSAPVTRSAIPRDTRAATSSVACSYRTVVPIWACRRSCCTSRMS
jgi:hypothetical protein